MSKIEFLLETIRLIDHSERELNKILASDKKEKIYSDLLKFHVENIKKINKKADKIINNRYDGYFK